MKKIFLTGLAAVIPIVVTVYLLIIIFSFVDGILGTAINRILQIYLGYKIPGIGIILFVLIVFLTGIFIHLSKMRLMRFFEGMFTRFPLVNKIYFPTKKMISFLFNPPHQAFQKAVLVEYPRKGIYSLGFITNTTLTSYAQKTGKKLFNVFIPSTPSPFSGYVILVEESELIILDTKVEEAVKLVVSGGLLNPDE